MSVAHRAGAVVVAGGASRRMGRDKATLELDGEPLVVRVVRVVAEVCMPVWVIGAPGRTLPSLPEGGRVVHDPPDRAGEGPLPAVLTGLEALAEEGIDAAYIGAVDTPALVPGHVADMLARLAETGADAVVPCTGDGPDARRHPLASAVRAHAVRERAARLVGGGERRVGRLFAAPLRVVEVREPQLRAPEALAPCNTPAEWARIRGSWLGR